MRAWKFGDDVNTDFITPGKYLFTTEPEELRKIVFIEHRPEFTDNVREGDVVVAGKNFGCGSSREHAPIAIKAAGVSAVVAKSFARIFFRNAINIGLPLLICDDADEIDDGDVVEINLEEGQIHDKTRNMILKARPLPRFVQGIVARGGLINYLRSGGYAQDRRDPR